MVVRHSSIFGVPRGRVQRSFRRGASSGAGRSLKPRFRHRRTVPFSLEATLGLRRCCDVSSFADGPLRLQKQPPTTGLPTTRTARGERPIAIAWCLNSTGGTDGCRASSPPFDSCAMSMLTRRKLSMCTQAFVHSITPA
jgi:hypothetical protein